LIYLEGAGAGGRAIMFRCSNLDAVKKLANSKARLKHGSPLGNDMFKAQLLKRLVNKNIEDGSIFADSFIATRIIQYLQRMVCLD
jgi:hypothetical protein